jgi:hypothetical protein
MLSYEVTIRLDDDSLRDAFESYMRGKHVSEVFATGCFVAAFFEQSAPGVYRSRYTVASQEELDRYLTEHAPRMREDFARHFPAGVTLGRAVWTEMALSSRDENGVLHR